MNGLTYSANASEDKVCANCKHRSHAYRIIGQNKKDSELIELGQGPICIKKNKLIWNPLEEIECVDFVGWWEPEELNDISE